MGRSEEDLKNLPPEKLEAIEAEVAERIKEMLLGQQESAKYQEAASAKARLYAEIKAL